MKLFGTSNLLFNALVALLLVDSGLGRSTVSCRPDGVAVDDNVWPSSTCTSASGTSGTAGASLLQKRALAGRATLELEEAEAKAPAASKERLEGRAMPGHYRRASVHSVPKAMPGKLWAASVLQKGGEAVFGLLGRSRSHAAYSAFMWRSVAVMEASRNNSNSELDGLITRFIEGHTSSEDSCPPKLMEAKHQLNQLHKEIIDLANQINNTEADVQKRESEVADTQPKLREVEDSCKNRSDALAEKKAADLRMLSKLHLEMTEMKAIAQPEVTMNLTNRSVQATGGPLGLLQKDVQPLGGVSWRVQALQAEVLVKKTKDAAKEVLSCLASVRDRRRSSVLEYSSARVAVPREGDCSANGTTSATIGNHTISITSPRIVRNQTYRSYSCNKGDPAYGGSIWLHCSNSVLSADAEGCIKIPNTVECQKQKTDLEQKYVKAFVELSRLIAEYEEITSSTDAEDALKEDCKQQREPPQEKIEKAVSDLRSKLLPHLQGLRPKLEDMLAAETKLRKHVADLKTTCSQLDATGRGLDSVRDAIHALQACPGLIRPEFHIPLFSGEWVSFELDNAKSDQANDAAMTAACQAKFGSGVRVAEVSEIEGGFIEGMPRNNTATLPLLPACPKCKGKPDSETELTNVDGHSRICWDTGKPLNRAHRREDCSKHLKAVACVRDRGDIRKNDWMAYQSVCPGTSTSFSPAESRQMLELQNKMRCTVGSSPLRWSQALQCQAQQWADKCKFDHSELSKSPIPASENVATGTDVDVAAWMWYSEYTMENPARSIKAGHFTAMVWNSSTELGCGICRNGTGVIVCQYANSSGNQAGNYDGNVPSYEGLASDYDRCRLNVTTAKANIQKFAGWGTITPLPSIVANLG